MLEVICGSWINNNKIIIQTKKQHLGDGICCQDLSLGSLGLAAVVYD